MKKRIIVISILVVVATGVALATVTRPFISWDHLKARSTDIVLAQCLLTPGMAPIREGVVPNELKDGLVASEIKVLSALKGGAKPGPTQLISRYKPRQGEFYLIFADFQSGSCDALESYHVIPLGLNFPTNRLAGKSLEDQIEEVLKWRLEGVNKGLRELQEEKARLESGLKTK